MVAPKQQCTLPKTLTLTKRQITSSDNQDWGLADGIPTCYSLNATSCLDVRSSPALDDGGGGGGGHNVTALAGALGVGGGELARFFVLFSFV